MQINKIHNAQSPSQMGYDIIVVGSCNVDLTNYVDRAPQPGETIIANSFETNFGGKGANQAVMAKLMGGKVSLVGKIGSDFFGTSYLDHLSAIDVNHEHIQRCSDVPTGTATIIVTCEGQNCIIINPGANKKVDSAYVQKVLPSLLVGSKLLLVQMEIDPEATLLALKLAKSQSVLTIFNTAPATTGITNEFYRFTDVLCCNEIEMQQLTSADCLANPAEIITGGRILMEAGCPSIIVTLGEKGAILFNNKFLSGFEVKVPIKIDKVVDTTGSGDAFLGSLAFFIVDQINASPHSQYLTPEIVKKAVATAAFTVTAKGAQSSYQSVIGTIKNHLSMPR